MRSTSPMQAGTRTMIRTMHLAICLAVCWASGVAGQESPATQTDRSPAERIAPLIDDQTILVAHVDLTRLDPVKVVEHLRRSSPNAGLLEDAMDEITNLPAKLLEAKVKDVFLVASLSDFVPPMGGPYLAYLVDGDPGTAAKAVRDASPDLEVASIGEFLVAGQPTAIDRLKAGHPASVRPELAEVFAASQGLPIRIAFIPNADVRRVLAETLVLPREFGGTDSEPFTKDIAWMGLGIGFDPEPRITMTVRTADETSAKLLASRTQLALEKLAGVAELQRVLPQAPRIVASLRPETRGNTMLIALGQEQLKQQDGADLFAPIRRARAAARRAQCMNNMKQFALAMHNYHDVHGRFPAGSADPADKPLLSWRVHVLPYIEQAPLYEQFHLDEPWDSEHNKTLIAKMPKLFACPAAPAELLAQGKTTYLVPTGADGLFNGPKGPRIQEILDGTSNTIMIVDGAPESAMIWTKPDDLAVDPAQPLKGLVGQHEDGFIVVMADGSARHIPKTIALETLRRLFHPKDGKPVENF